MPSILPLMLLAFVQNISFTMVSRARNRNSKVYHMIASVFSNGLWFCTIGIIIQSQLEEMNLLMAIPYIAGTVAGSLVGADLSIWIEKRFNLST